MSTKAEDFIFSSYMNALPYMQKGYDEVTRKPELARTLLDLLGNPERGIPMILVAGSKGKGSVSRMIAFLLEKMGYRVGHYSSPHLLDFTERIRVNGKAIRNEDLERLTEQVKPHVELIKLNPLTGEYISPIAISQAMAMLYFREMDVQVGVIEVGRGGRFDDTNQLPHQIAVITPLMEEHLDKLGPTIEQVVWHKLGVIRDSTQAVLIGKQSPLVDELIMQQLLQSNSTAKVYQYGEEFKNLETQTSLEGTQTSIELGEFKLPQVTLPLLGEFQAENLALAYAVVDIFTEGRVKQYPWGEHLLKLRWPGRCEVIDRKPLTLLDGGIHRSSAEMVARLIEPLSYSKLHVVLAIPKGKDIEGVMKVWAPKADLLITTEATNPYLDFYENYQELLDRFTEHGKHIASPTDAVAQAKVGLDLDGILVLMGTLSFVADMKRLWGESIRDL